MLYAILLQTCKWLEYCACYCLTTAETSLEDYYSGEYYALSKELNQTNTYLFDQVLANNSPNSMFGINYQCFI